MNDGVITGLGEVLWDLLPEGRKIGGAPANFACHVSQFGLESCVVSAVGRDELGDEIVGTFAAKGLVSLVERVDYPTGVVRVEVDGAGIPRYEFAADTAWDNIPFTPQLESLARRTRAVCFGSLAQRSEVSRATIHRFLDAMPADEAVLRIFDVNLRQDFYDAVTLERSMQRCNVLKINDEELAIVGSMFGCGDEDAGQQCRRLVERYDLRMLILTCGTAGSYVFTRGESSFCETPRVEVADTVGAGDSFTAAFIASIVRGRSIAESHRRAVDVSAFVCTQKGAMPVLPAELRR